MSDHLCTERLLLRPPEARDAARFAALLGDYDVSKNLASAPYPYYIAEAQAFIVRAAAWRASGAQQVFAIARKTDGIALGCMGVGPQEGAMVLGYWLGKPYWGHGYATEAGRAVVAAGFALLAAGAAEASHFRDNPASGRVLAKLGFTVLEEPCAIHSRARGGAAPGVRYRLTRERFEAAAHSL